MLAVLIIYCYCGVLKQIFPPGKKTLKPALSGATWPGLPRASLFSVSPQTSGTPETEKISS